MRALACLTALGIACAARGALAGDCARPTDPGGIDGYAFGSAAVQSFGTSAVRVWYTTTGEHAVNAATTRGDGVPDDVANVAAVTTAALASYASMGFRAPVSDAATPACGSFGGDGRLDVYLVHMVGGDGTTVAEAGRCSAAGAADACASFILAQADYASLYPTADIGIRTVLPHETFHAVQDAYDANLDRFWAEGTAQWAAKTLDPALTDLERFLPAFFRETDRSLDAPSNGVTSSFLYGAAIWPVFLTQRHGDAIVRAILEQEARAGGAALVATDTVLQAMQGSLALDYAQFAAWNAGTGSRAGSGGYADAAHYPEVAVAELTGDGASGTTSGFASYYFHVAVDAPATIALDADPARTTATLVPLSGGRAREDQAVALPATLEGGEAIVVVSGITASKTDARFSLALAPAAGSGSGDAMHDDGGCATTGGASPSAAIAGVLLALVSRRRDRRRRHRRRRVPAPPAAS